MLAFDIGIGTGETHGGLPLHVSHPRGVDVAVFGHGAEEGVHVGEGAVGVVEVRQDRRSPGEELVERLVGAGDTEPGGVEFDEEPDAVGGVVAVDAAKELVHGDRAVPGRIVTESLGVLAEMHEGTAVREDEAMVAGKDGEVVHDLRKESFHISMLCWMRRGGTPVDSRTLEDCRRRFRHDGVVYAIRGT